VRTGHAACIGEEDCRRDFDEIARRNTSKTATYVKGNIQIDPREIGWGGMDWTVLV
jgi:hypothetical protein